MRVSFSQMTNSGVRELLARQAEVQYTQMQLATQKRVLKPSDDPVAATSINFLRTEIAQIEQFNRNGDMAISSNELEESALASTTDILFQIRDLSVTLGNGAYGKNEFDAVKVELEERLQELLGLANTRNASGDYLFSGSKVASQPFIANNSGGFDYNGDQDQRLVQISSGVSVPVSDSGFDIFVDVKNGNGKFTTHSSAANLGNGRINPGSFSAAQPFLTEPYDISFALNGAGDLEYTVTDRNTATIVTGPNAYQDGQDISFNGVQTSIAGEPQDGDNFSIEPSVSQDLFSTVQNMINAIDNFVDNSEGRAQLTNTLAREQASLDNSMQNIDLVRGRVGSSLNSIDSEKSSNLSLLITSRSTLSTVEDLDVVEASTRLSQQLVILEAAQASFVRVRDLNLFNFLR